jgi:DNA mismatch repair protein MutS2
VRTPHKHLSRVRHFALSHFTVHRSFSLILFSLQTLMNTAFSGTSDTLDNTPDNTLNNTLNNTPNNERDEPQQHSLASQTHILQEQELQEQSLDELEFPKVLERVSEFALSDLGKEIVLSAAPTPDTAWLRDEHQRVEETIRLLNIGERLPLDGLSDVRSMLRKAQISGAYLTPGELLQMRDMMRSSRLLRSFANTHSEQARAMAEFCAPLHDNRLLEKHIGEAIDDVGNVRDTASLDLARIRREIFDTSNRLRQRLNKILKKIAEEDLAQEEFISQREGRFVLPMKTEYKRFVPGIIHGVSGSGSTVFLEPAETFDMNNELTELHGEELREIQRILTTLTAEIATDVPDFMRSVSILARVDALQAKARYANEYDCFKPDIVDDPQISLSKVYHPVLVQTKGKKNVVPLSIEFDGATIMGHLISGPNAGGKTVALKSIGLNIALALAGFFPCGVCRTNYRTIFSAIGDQQSIENDVSTFSSQMLRLREILANASSTTLALVDEICSGTDPQEGAALAVGILEGLQARKAFFVVTTHQSSLKSYALTQKHISNASMEFNTEKMQSTYKFLSGVPGNSYAFVLAKNLGIPPRVMQRAQEYLGDKHSTLEESIEIIQQYRRDAERMTREAEDVKSRAEKRKTEYDTRFAEFKTKYNELMRLAKQEAADIVGGANKLVENTIREIRETSKEAIEMKASMEAALEAKKTLEKNQKSARTTEQNADKQNTDKQLSDKQSADKQLSDKQSADKQLSDKQSTDKKAATAATPTPASQTTTTAAGASMSDIKKAFEAEKQRIQEASTNVGGAQTASILAQEAQELNAGDAVTMEDFQMPGVIVALDRETNHAVVEFDSVKFRTSLDKLTRASAKQVKQADKGKKSGVELHFSAETRLDLRGMYTDEAIKTVEQAIASALTGAVHSLTIVHGKGTGALRQAIQRHLQNHPAVTNYRDGMLNEGGAGVTIAELK